MINSKLAEVPIVILVLGVLFLCVLTFVNFSLFSLKSDRYAGLEKIGEIEECSIYIEQYCFYLNIGYSQEKIKTLPVFNQEEKFFIDSESNFVCNLDGIKITYPLSKIQEKCIYPK